MNEDAEQWLRRNPEQVQEMLRQDGLIHGGLIAIGVVMVQPFLTAASLDLSAKVCVVAFSVAIPLLAVLVLVNQQEVVRRRMTRSVPVGTTRMVARSCAFAGVVAGSWHILWIAGVGVLAGGLVGWRLNRQATGACDRIRQLRSRNVKHLATPGHSGCSWR